MLLYAAANLANPATAPLLLFAEAQIGHHLLHGVWLDLTLHEVRAAGLAGLGMLFADVVVGWAVAGSVVSLALGAGTFLVSRLSRLPAAYQRIVDDVVRRYLEVSIRDAEGARARLLRDPIYPFLLAEGTMDGARVLDLGCGRALAAAVSAAVDAVPHAYLGVDVNPRYVRVARETLGDRSGHRFVEADLRDFDPPPADLVLLCNVLRFLPLASQDALLRRLAKALPPGARVIVREVDASRGGTFRTAQVKDLLAALMPRRPHRRAYYRRGQDLRNALAAAGFEVRDRSTVHTTPRARVLLEAVRKPVAAPLAGA
jgi:SAM-dependent methyltransferase